MYTMYNFSSIFKWFRSGSKDGLRDDLRANYQWLIILGVLILILYANLYGSEFVSDDKYLILNNENFGSVKYLFSNLLFFPSLFFQHLTFLVFGKSPTAFHLLNILLHIISVQALFLILKKLFNEKFAIFSAILFAIHPVFTESVSWISGISTIQYSSLFLVSLLLYLYSKAIDKYFWFSYGFLILSVASSNRAFVMPLILIAYELLFKSDKWKYKIVLLLFPFIIFLTANILGIGERSESLAQDYYSNNSLYNPLTQIPTAVSKYIELYFVPTNLTLYYTELNMGGIVLFLRVILLLGFIYLGNEFYKKDKKVFLFFLIFFINLLPTLTPLPVAWIVAERYAYLSFLSLIVITVKLMLLKEKKFGKTTLNVLMVMLVCILSIITFLRNLDWRNEDNLWVATGKTSPSSSQNHNNLGDVYSRNGDLNKAVEEFSKATQLKPNYADAYHNLANTYQQLGQVEKAIENYNLAIKYNPNLWQSYQNLAQIYFEQKDYDSAIKNLELTYKIIPNNLNLLNNIGIVYMTVDEKVKAKETFEQVLSIDPVNQVATEIILKLK